MSQMPREKAARLGRETVALLREGRYVSSRGVQVDISAQLDNAVTKTKEYPPDGEMAIDPKLGLSPQISVENETVMGVGRRLAGNGSIAALNFASATLPAEGF